MSLLEPPAGRPPQQQGLARQFLGFGIGSLVTAILILGLEVVTGYGPRGIVQNKAKTDADAIKAIKDEANQAIEDMKRTLEKKESETQSAVNYAVESMKKTLAEMEEKIQALETSRRDSQKELRATLAENKTLKTQIDNLKIELTKAKKESTRTSPLNKNAPEPDDAKPEIRSEQIQDNAPLLRLQGQAVSKDPECFQRSTGGLNRFTYSMSFPTEPKILSIGNPGLDSDTNHANTFTVSGVFKEVRESLGTINRSGPPWKIELQPRPGRQSPTPALQAGFVKVKLANDMVPRYCLTYQPQKFPPQSFEPQNLENDSDWQIWRCPSLEKELVRLIEDYREYILNGGILSLGPRARVTVDGREYELTPPTNLRRNEPVRWLSNANDNSTRPKANRFAIELNSQGFPLLKVARASTAKSCVIESLSVVRPLESIENLRTDHALVFSIAGR